MFYLNQFELHLQEALLKRGYRLFCQNQVKEFDKNAHYQIGQHHLHALIKNNQLKKYTCSCGALKYCEHLAATLFFVQQMKLPLPKDLEVFGKTKKPKKPAMAQFEALQQIIFKSSLVGFAEKEQGKKAGQFAALVNLLRSNLKSCKPNVPLTQEQIDELCQVLQQAAALIHANADITLSLEWALATHAFFHHLHLYRFGGDDAKLWQIKTDTEHVLRKYITAGLHGSHKQIWFKALVRSLQSNQLMKSRGFYFLCPPYLAHCKKTEELAIIEALLLKRKYLKTYDEAFDPLAVVKHMLQFSVHAMPNKWVFDDTSFEPEYYIALAEWYFLKNQNAKAFLLIDACLERLIVAHKPFVRMFTGFAISKSEEYANREKNMAYLSFSLLHNYQFNPAELERLCALWPKKDHDAHINHLLSCLPQNPAFDSKEKTIALLKLLNDRGRLIQFLCKETNRFHLLHQTLLYDPLLMTAKAMEAYARQLGQSLQHAVSFARQETLLMSCMPLLKVLTGEQFSTLINLLYVQTGYESPLGRLLGKIAEQCLAEKTK